MKFARYAQTNEGPHAFTIGKIYLAYETAKHEGSADYSRFTITNDDEERVTIETDNNEFKYMDKVYGVWISDNLDYSDGTLTKGTCFLIDGADGDMLHIENIGNFQATNFEVLDRTNLYPGVKVLNMETLEWTDIARVDDSEWISLRSKPDQRMAPRSVMFAVGSGGILEKPLAICNDSSGWASLVEGRTYELFEMNVEEQTVVVELNGVKILCESDRFSFE